MRTFYRTDGSSVQVTPLQWRQRTAAQARAIVQAGKVPHVNSKGRPESLTPDAYAKRLARRHAAVKGHERRKARATPAPPPPPAPRRPVADIVQGPALFIETGADLQKLIEAVIDLAVAEAAKRSDGAIVVARFTIGEKRINIPIAVVDHRADHEGIEFGDFRTLHGLDPDDWRRRIARAIANAPHAVYGSSSLGDLRAPDEFLSWIADDEPVGEQADEADDLTPTLVSVDLEFVR